MSYAHRTLSSSIPTHEYFGNNETTDCCDRRTAAVFARVEYAVVVVVVVYLKNNNKQTVRYLYRAIRVSRQLRLMIIV